MLPTHFLLALMTASASAHYMQVTTWSGKNCHGSSEIGCKKFPLPLVQPGIMIRLYNERISS